jgi:hypothetical protein
VKAAGISALFAGALLLLATDAHAQQKEPFRSAYFSIMLGESIPENTDLKSGFAFYFAQGFMLNQHFGVQAELGGFSISDNNDIVTMSEGVGVSLKLAVPVSFIEPYLLAGAGLDVDNLEFPVHAAFGIDINFSTLQIGVEARQIWYETDGLNLDSLLVIEKISFRF